MRRQENIYIQSENSCVRNKDILNVNTSSDICVFYTPTFNMTGATKIMTGMTSTSDGVHIVTNLENTIDMDIVFTGNLDSFLVEELFFNFDVFKLNGSDFLSPPIYTSPFYSNPSLNSYTVEPSIPIDNLNIDGEYLLKGKFNYKVCTDILSRLNLRNITTTTNLGMPYNGYNETYDFYFIAVREADIPQFTVGITDTNVMGNLVVVSFVVETNENVFTLDTPPQGSPMVTLNGLVLANELDYTFSALTLTLNGPTIPDDIVNMIFVGKSNTDGLVGQNIIVDGFIPSGPLGGEGNNDVYLNTTTNKYEVYTVTTPKSSDVVITLNGVVLANGIDYYQSVTKGNRFILEGSLVVGDIVTIIYNGDLSYIGNVDTTSFAINWTILNAPQNTFGKFITEVSSDNSFVNITYTAETNYVVGQNGYSSDLFLSGAMGTELFYRVKNEKNYITISNDIIQSSAYSEIIPIVINTNSFNSY